MDKRGAKAKEAVIVAYLEEKDEPDFWGEYFWTGTTFSPEYPDAMKYPSPKEANREMIKIGRALESGKGFRTDVFGMTISGDIDLLVIVNYGLDDQEITDTY